MEHSEDDITGEETTTTTETKSGRWLSGRQYPKAEMNTPKDTLKLEMDLLPPEAIKEVVAALQNGANKYGPYNWRLRPNSYSTLVGAILRHTFAFIDGENIDPDSGLHHMAHVCAGALILLDEKDYPPERVDDRPIKNAVFEEDSK